MRAPGRGEFRDFFQLAEIFGPSVETGKFLSDGDQVRHLHALCHSCGRRTPWACTDPAAIKSALLFPRPVSSTKPYIDMLREQYQAKDEIR